MEQSTLQGSPAVQSVGQAANLRTQLWQGLQEKFLKGEPKVLGVVQIIIALINFSLGIIMMNVRLSPYGPTQLSAYLWYTVWGSIMFIISGSLSVATGIRTTKGMVRGSLGLNTISSLLAFAGMIISIMGVMFFVFPLHQCNYNQKSEGCVIATILMGLEGMVFVLSVLEFCIAVSLAAFGCKVTCCNPGGVVLILPSNPPVTETASPAPFKEV